MDQIEIEPIRNGYLVRDCSQGDQDYCETFHEAVGYARRINSRWAGEQQKEPAAESLLVEALESIKRYSTQQVIIQIALDALAKHRKDEHDAG